MTSRLSAAALLVLVACEAPAAGPPASWLTLSSLRAAYEADPEQALAAGAAATFPDGFPASQFLSAPERIRISPAYTNGQQTAYVTTDVWVNFPLVWLQPLYVFVSAWNETPPRANWVTSLPWVATVGEKSAFWSPFWRVYYVLVPADTPPDRYRSSHDILSAGLPIFPGQARLLTLAPPGGIALDDASSVLLPELREPAKVGKVRPQPVWVEGESEERLGLDFGENRFEWNDRYEILEQPLYFFFVRNSAGAWAPLVNVPRVGGTGPPFERRPPIAPNNRPRFGSNWRLWAARLPGSARLFVPPDRQPEWEARNRGATASLPLATVPAVTSGGAPASSAELDRHAYKVLLDVACLANGPITVEQLAQCPWLDSQEALERHLPASLLASEVMVACPYVSFAGTAVPDP